ncbi:hypothetical protein Tco_1449842 [Tanacetum coccineum]
MERGVVRIPLEGDEILRVHGECTQGVVKTLMNTKPLTRYSFVILFDCCNPWSSLISLNRGSFDVIVGMDWLSKRKFVIVCHEKVVRIPLEGDEILRVHGERTQGVVKTLVNTKTRVSYDLVIFREEHQCRLLRREAWSSFEVSVGITEEGEVVTYLRLEYWATPQSDESKVEKAPAEMLRDLDQQMEKRADDDAAECVRDAIGFEYCLASSSGWTK